MRRTIPIFLNVKFDSFFGLRGGSISSQILLKTEMQKAVSFGRFLNNSGRQQRFDGYGTSLKQLFDHFFGNEPFLRSQTALSQLCKECEQLFIFMAFQLT